MKMRVWGILFIVGFIMVPIHKANAIWWVVVKAAVKKAIIAADLAIQKQQNKVIWLQNAQKVIENTMSKLKLNEISDWTQKQRDLYKNYFEELNKVKTLIAYYQRVREIGQRQIDLVQEYKRAWNILKTNKFFRPSELEEMEKVYTEILQQSVKNVDELIILVKSFHTQMSDFKRIELINQIAEKVDQNFVDLKIYSAENLQLAAMRENGVSEEKIMRTMYGFE